MKTKIIFFIIVFNFTFLCVSSSQKYLSLELLPFIGDLKSVQISYDVFKDSKNTFSLGPIINFKNNSDISYNNLDGREIVYNLRKGFNGGISLGYTKHISKYLNIQNTVKIEYNRLNLITNTASISDTIGDVIHFNDFEKKNVSRNVFTMTNSLGLWFDFDAGFFKIRIGPNINFSGSGFTAYFPNNDIIESINIDSPYHTKVLSRYIFSYNEKFNIFPSLFLSLNYKISD